ELRLLLEESLAREQTWMTKALQAQRQVGEARLAEQQLSLWRAINLEEELERVRGEHVLATRRAMEAEKTVAKLSAYHRAVEASKSWRLLQFLRGLVGRKW
ncbi:MAG: hypothetical protein ACRD1Z_18460, partial [Vicinamibacteria bacterium]